jgi:hypothetical protein
MNRALLVLVLDVSVVAAVAVAMLLNLVLLDRASPANDPVGRLSPGVRVLPAAPRWTVRPVTGPVEDRGADD